MCFRRIHMTFSCYLLFFDIAMLVLYCVRV